MPPACPVAQPMFILGCHKVPRPGVDAPSYGNYSCMKRMGGRVESNSELSNLELPQSKALSRVNITSMWYLE